MRIFLLSVLVYMAFNYMEYALFLFICGNEVYDAWYEESAEYFEVPLLIRIRRLITIYIAIGFITIPITIVLMIDRFLKNDISPEQDFKLLLYFSKEVLKI